MALTAGSAFAADSLTEDVDLDVGGDIDIEGGDILTSRFDEFDVHIYNWCNHPIEVAASWLASGTAASWVVDGWWSLQPGGDAYIFDTENRYVYFYARTTDGSNLEWRGSNCDNEVRGERVCMFETNMGRTYSSFTQNFSC